MWGLLYLWKIIILSYHYHNFAHFWICTLSIRKFKISPGSVLASLKHLQENGRLGYWHFFVKGTPLEVLRCPKWDCVWGHVHWLRLSFLSGDSSPSTASPSQGTSARTNITWGNPVLNNWIGFSFYISRTNIYIYNAKTKDLMEIRLVLYRLHASSRVIKICSG